MQKFLGKLKGLSQTGWGYLPGARHVVPAPARPPLLVISMPRSGSSWIGSILGASRSVAYMREPFTASRGPDGIKRTIFPLTPEADSLPHYKRAIALAMQGIPAFPHSVLRYPEQWQWTGRADRRVIIKEINPKMLPFLVERYDFETVFVLRHPLSIVQSFSKLGWWDRGNADICMRRVARCWQTAQQALEGRRHLYVHYEDVCLAPSERFAEILDWAGIAFDDRVEAVLARSIGTGDRADTYSTVRNPQEMAFAWKAEFSQTEADAFHDAYARHGLAFYRDRADWLVD